MSVCSTTQKCSAIAPQDSCFCSSDMSLIGTPDQSKALCSQAFNPTLQCYVVDFMGLKIPQLMPVCAESCETCMNTEKCLTCRGGYYDDMKSATPGQANCLPCSEIMENCTLCENSMRCLSVGGKAVTTKEQCTGKFYYSKPAGKQPGSCIECTKKLQDGECVKDDGKVSTPGISGIIVGVVFVVGAIAALIVWRTCQKKPAQNGA